jgi:hypothetical protein
VGIFLWIEETPLADYIRTSALGFPLMIALHAVGLAVMVGIAVMLALRYLGAFQKIPFEALSPLFNVAWLGLIINTISGSCLFAAQASTYPTSVPFLIKITFVFAGAIAVGYLQVATNRGAAFWNATGIPGSVKAVAALSIVFWTIAMVTGRLIAYL